MIIASLCFAKFHLFSAVYSQENVTEESQLSNTRKQEIKAEKEDGRNEESQERKRKARVPGFSINGPAEAQLSLDILTQIGNVNLPRTILAAIEILFIRRKCLEHGPFPICDPSANSLGQISKDIETDSNSTTGSKSDSQKFEHSDKNHQNNNLDEERVNQGNFNVKSTLTDKDLLNFASTNSKEKFPALHSWLHLQLEKNRALADLQSGKGDFFLFQYSGSKNALFDFIDPEVARKESGNSIWDDWWLQTIDCLPEVVWLGLDPFFLALFFPMLAWR